MANIAAIRKLPEKTARVVINESNWLWAQENEPGVVTVRVMDGTDVTCEGTLEALGFLRRDPSVEDLDAIAKDQPTAENTRG